jgi:hypothetical protein
VSTQTPEFLLASVSTQIPVILVYM